ncbi:MAG: hypothetical protein B6226_01980 [Candidatus Cloacimonetes bacterium 4572_65]|nr:MAG: hypothetical protein B6226_01980 [Candidatus Cloacimonetes bacterium 4572_65]
MKILIIRFSSLGDIILTESVIRTLKKAFPHAEIDYLTKPPFKPLIEKFFPINNVYTEYNNLAGLLDLKKSRYDIVLDLHDKLNSTLAKLVINGKKSITYKKKRLLRERIVAHKTTTKIDSTVDLYGSVLDKLKIPFLNKNPQIEVTKKSSLLPNKNSVNVVLFPGATHNTKRLPTSKFIDFIKRSSNSNTNFYLMGSNAEKELTREIKSHFSDNVLDVAGKFNLVELIEAIDEGDVLITNDSGPMHIGAALGKPQIAFFGSTNLSLGFRPLNNNAKVISLNLACSPCTLHGEKVCPKGHFKCLEDINVDDIVQTYNNLI